MGKSLKAFFKRDNGLANVKALRDTGVEIVLIVKQAVAWPMKVVSVRTISYVEGMC